MIFEEPMKAIISGLKLTFSFLLISMAAVGCGRAKQPWETVYETTGTLVFDGKPLAGAQITLIPEEPEVPGTVRPTATTDDDGAFELGTYAKADGAPAGTYKVVAMRYPIVGSKESPSAGPNNLPAKYSRPETSDLKVEITPTGIEPAELTLRR
jgi:hypothetical protein